MRFDTWLDTFVREKGINGDDVFVSEGPSGPNHIPVAILMDAMKSAPSAEQESIKGQLVHIDFAAPGRDPIMDYFAHIGRAIAV